MTDSGVYSSQIGLTVMLFLCVCVCVCVHWFCAEGGKDIDEDKLEACVSFLDLKVMTTCSIRGGGGSDKPGFLQSLCESWQRPPPHYFILCSGANGQWWLTFSA